MKGTSKMIMGATLVLVVSLAMVLGLILVLLAELYCSLLLRRRRLRTNASSSTAAVPITTTTVAAASSSSSSPSNDHHHHHHHHRDIPPPTTPLSSFYAQGVLQAPRSLLFPAVSFKDDSEKQRLSELFYHQVIDIPNNKQTEPTIPSSTPSPPPPPPPSSTITLSASSSEPTQSDDRKPTAAGNNDNHLVYISNPIYENAENDRPNTPFETPDTSPSRLEETDDEEVGVQSSSPSWSSPSSTPPLTPMKKLPGEASSVSLRDASSLATISGSDSNYTNNALSSSSSGSPCTSPSW